MPAGTLNNCSDNATHPSLYTQKTHLCGHIPTQQQHSSRTKLEMELITWRDRRFAGVFQWNREDPVHTHIAGCIHTYTDYFTHTHTMLTLTHCNKHGQPVIIGERERYSRGNSGVVESERDEIGREREIERDYKEGERARSL